MEGIKDSIGRAFNSALGTFKTYPATNGCALAFTIVTWVRIWMDWPAQEPFNFLFNCLHLGLAIGVLWSLAAIALAQSLYGTGKSSLIAYGVGLAAAGIAIGLLLRFGADPEAVVKGGYQRVSELAAARVAVGYAVALIAFVVVASYPKTVASFSKALFMTQKAFVIAALYGGVLMAGVSGVIGAIQALLYRDMDEKVYSYFAAMVGFVAFTLFVGYFPTFKKGAVDERRDTAQRQPRFIEVLFGSIAVPLMLAMTVVLLLWAGKTVISSDWPPFYRLSAIATAYATTGVWLHLMVTEHSSKLASFYRRLFPYTALVILVFEAWALLVQLGRFGMKNEEYFFILTWVGTAAAVGLLLVLRERSHHWIARSVAVLLVVSVMPVLGYQVQPVYSQVHRLEAVLLAQGMFIEGAIVPAKAELPVADREAITDAVSFLQRAEPRYLPEWFKKDYGEPLTFQKTFGFEQQWPSYEAIGEQGRYLSTNLTLAPEALDISGYHWMIPMQNYFDRGYAYAIDIVGSKGKYRLVWNTQVAENPSLKIQRDDTIVLDEDLKGYLDNLIKRYPLSTRFDQKPVASDMTVAFENEHLKVLLVFSNINFNLEPDTDRLATWTTLSAVYLDEK